MPYKVIKRNGSYVVVNRDSGKIVAGNKTRLSKSRAEAVMRARYAHEDKKMRNK